MSDTAYRPCIGILLVARDGRAFVGRRKGMAGDAQYAWQMPQGGIDEDEDPLDAAIRELWEETNARSVELIAESPDWFQYDLPADVLGKAWKGRWRGQTQKWFAFRFTGPDSEIDIDNPGGGAHRPEFDAWRWERLEALPGLVVPFKRPVYEKVVAAFLPLVAP